LLSYSDNKHLPRPRIFSYGDIRRFRTFEEGVARWSQYGARNKR